MKSLILFTFFVFSGLTLAKEKLSILADLSDFSTLSDVESSEFTLFLSYGGKAFNHCGIKLRSHSFTTEVESLNKVIMITNDSVDEKNEHEIGELKNKKIIAKVFDENDSVYGQYFTIKTRSGKSLKEEIEKLDKFVKVEVIAEILPCTEE